MKVSEPVKKGSAIFMVVFVAIAVVVLITFLLFSYWTAGPSPVAYVIRDVRPNNEHLQDQCDDSHITVVENAVTGQMVYKCGNLGKTNEVITFYE